MAIYDLVAEFGADFLEQDTKVIGGYSTENPRRKLEFQ